MFAFIYNHFQVYPCTTVTSVDDCTTLTPFSKDVIFGMGCVTRWLIIIALRSYRFGRAIIDFLKLDNCSFQKMYDSLPPSKWYRPTPLAHGLTYKYANTTFMSVCDTQWDRCCTSRQHADTMQFILIQSTT